MNAQSLYVKMLAPWRVYKQVLRMGSHAYYTGYCIRVIGLLLYLSCLITFYRKGTATNRKTKLWVYTDGSYGAYTCNMQYGNIHTPTGYNACLHSVNLYRCMVYSCCNIIQKRKGNNYVVFTCFFIPVYVTTQNGKYDSTTLLRRL
jgi:hypothetical protein